MPARSARAARPSSPSPPSRRVATAPHALRSKISKRCLKMLSVSECVYLASLKKKERRRIHRALSDVADDDGDDDRVPLRLRVLRSALPAGYKQRLFAMLAEDDSDKARSMVQCALRIPFGKYSPSPSELDAAAAKQEREQQEDAASTTVAETDDEEEEDLVSSARRAVAHARRVIEEANALQEDVVASDVDAEAVAVNVDVQAEEEGTTRGAFLRRAASVMDAEITGQQQAKREVLSVLARWHAGGGAPHAIALEGPPGNGKTSFVKRALAAALGRPLITICLGGASDASYLLGHGYTFEGARCGRLADALADAKVMDPILFFDEVDKVSDTPRGDELLNALVHLTDPVQNNALRDRYLYGLDLDLSRCLVVLAYNDPRRVRSPVLLDRVKRIEVATPDAGTRWRIAEQHLLPRARAQTRCVLPMDAAALQRVVDVHSSDPGMRGVERSLAEVLGVALVCDLLGDQSAAFGGGGDAGDGGGGSGGGEEGRATRGRSRATRYSELRGTRLAACRYGEESCKAVLGTVRGS